MGRAGRSGLRLLPVTAVVSAALFCVASPRPRAAAQSGGPSQFDVQAVYLFDFAKFVHWPAPPSRGIDLCVAGQRPLLDALKRTLAGESLNGSPLHARAVEHAEDETGCALLFIDGNAHETEQMLRVADGKPILTVGDGADFLAHGGMIQFVIVQDRVRFAVNLAPVSRSGLTLSSELLKVATHVEGVPATAGGAE
jgi:hypothetical protein